MDSIYLTKWGSYVDLSKIALIEEGHPQGFEISVQFQLCEGKTGIDIYKNGNTLNVKESIEDLVNAWKEYKVSKIQVSDIVDNDVFKFLKETSELMEEKPRKTFQDRLNEEMAKKKSL